MRSNILIIDPNSRIRRAARQLLEQEDHDIFESPSLDAGLSAANGQNIDLVFLSWRGNGPMDHRLARIKENDSTRESQVILAAAQGDLTEALTTLDLGADDSMSVPFLEAEFRARVNACLRRKHETSNAARLAAGPIVLDKTVHRLFVDERSIDLAPTEFRLMAFFLENQNRVFSRRELLQGAWKKNANAGPRTVDVHVRRLRKVLEPFGYDDMIQTVRSFGYRFASKCETTGAQYDIDGGRQRPVRHNG